MSGMGFRISVLVMTAGIMAAGGVARAAEEAPVGEAQVVTNQVQSQATHVATQTVNQVETPAAVPVAPSVVTPPAPSVVTPPAAEAVKIPEVEATTAWTSASWQIGTRFLQVKLQDDIRGTPNNGSFFGTITQIHEKQDNAPDKIYLQYRLFQSAVWVGVSYDHFMARTMDDGNGDGIADMIGSDGDEEIKGAIPYLQAAWDNDTRFTPYAQIGYAFYQAKFLPNSWGANGTRWVDAKSGVHGVELGGGLNIRLYKNLSADLFARSMKVNDITGDWYYNHGMYGGPFVMTMSYVAYGGGVSWRF